MHSLVNFHAYTPITTLLLCIYLYTVAKNLILQISYSSNPVGDTVVQLNRFDRLFKLSTDLQYLFIYQPTATHTMLLSKIEELYEECYGHKLSSAVYGSPTVELLFDHKQVKYLIKVRTLKSLCVIKTKASIFSK